MLEFKAELGNEAAPEATTSRAEMSLAEISQANLFQVEISRAPGKARRDWLADFDFLGPLVAFFCGAAWSTDRMEPRPLRVKTAAKSSDRR